MLSETALSIISITGAIALGAMSPGQSFILVARTAVASSRGDGMAVALGMGVGCFVFALLALLGLQSLLLALPWLYGTSKRATCRPSRRAHPLTPFGLEAPP